MRQGYHNRELKQNAFFRLLSLSLWIKLFLWESIYRANQHIRIMREVKYQSNSAAKQCGLIITSLFIFIFVNRNRYDCVIQSPKFWNGCENTFWNKCE